ncbi:hypothetical protein [Enterovibrio norvegicus]|uniref:hypothetical protein n=1 Tax=Enterovibrio norvegicus TaxID=188144 RepID=UPI00030C46FF|nr:hypothetical protein [Enterovibrio norvegicus]
MKSGYFAAFGFQTVAVCGYYYAYLSAPVFCAERLVLKPSTMPCNEHFSLGIVDGFLL